MTPEVPLERLLLLTIAGMFPIITMKSFDVENWDNCDRLKLRSLVIEAHGIERRHAIQTRNGMWFFQA
jgi:hypothetical protein